MRCVNTMYCPCPDPISLSPFQFRCLSIVALHNHRLCKLDSQFDCLVHPVPCPLTYALVTFTAHSHRSPTWVLKFSLNPEVCFLNSPYLPHSAILLPATSRTAVLFLIPTRFHVGFFPPSRLPLDQTTHPSEPPAPASLPRRRLIFPTSAI